MIDSGQAIRQDIAHLIDNRQSIELATLSKAGTPCISYAPFVGGANLCFYVFVSDLAPHTSNLRNNPHVSVMVIDDESASPNVFARCRLILDCQATQIHRKSDEFMRWIPTYKNRFGTIIDTLLELTDFHLFKLIPQQGTFIKGFGQAFQITGESMNEVKHLYGRPENPTELSADDGAVSIKASPTQMRAKLNRTGESV